MDWPDDKRTWRLFLVLGLCTDSSYLKGRPFRWGRRFSGAPVKFAWMECTSDRPMLGEAMLLMRSTERITVRQALDCLAVLRNVDAADSFCGHHTLELYVLPLPANYVKAHIRLDIDEIVAAKQRDLDDRGEWMLRAQWGIKAYVKEDWLYGLAPVLRRHLIDERFASAASYLNTSVHDLRWDMCDWREEDFDPDFDPYLPPAEAESAYLHAFKAIEALVGEPGKNHRIKEALAKVGIDPEASFKFGPDIVPIAETIHQFLHTRDHTAGHGSPQNKRKLKLPEIFKVQAVARHMILFAPDERQS